ncbi:hypothetical protein B0H13DRAFT_1876047 [Mycena leptocephala]|nr:hypothetical protein B0H13DRAFT_1876047 [Mycena leptocephala]
MGSAHTLIDAKGQWSGPKQAQSSAVEDIRVFSRADPPESQRVPVLCRSRLETRAQKEPQPKTTRKQEVAQATVEVRKKERCGRAACIGKVVAEDEKRGNWNAVEKNVAHFEPIASAGSREIQLTQRRAGKKDAKQGRRNNQRENRVLHHHE